jgi:hypothetical protein
MKNQRIHFIFFILFISFSFTLKDEIGKYMLRNGDVIIFSNKPAGNDKGYMSMSRGSYDGSGFEFKLDSNKNVSISAITHARGPRQDGFIILGCTGKLARVKENLIITFEKYRKSYYLVNLDSASIVGTFDTIAKVTLKSTDLQGKPAEYYCSEKYSGNSMRIEVGPDGRQKMVKGKDNSPKSSISLLAVPPGTNYNDLYKANHKENTIAHFTYFSIETQDGKIILYPPGNYILCEGNTISMK